ncbi:MAG: 3-hydroxyacyl-CoA dehydrogenase NAD-binding domain-containing protein [Acidobacteria bacterium]|nr:3-hydroxyacyl-CoA dehydrogenase NAD-binding domain-containing protein [Acidobacteriota bacterium]
MTETDTIIRPIRSVAVLGAGTMGAQIAAHVANAGLPVVLLDLDATAAGTGLKRAASLKPDPFFTKEARALVTLGGFHTDLAAIADADWIIEVVIERLDAKQALLERVEAHRRADAIVTSNTSGIPIGTIAEGRSEGFRRHWAGTHFFNPPRYLRLVEIIPTPETDPAVVATLSDFVDRRLGKGVVVAKDTPNFIANRIGLFGVMRVLEQLETGQYTIEQIDALTGPLVGRPKSATFRTMDIAGIDILTHVATNLAERLESAEERSAFVVPALVQKLVERGWIGEKAGQGFYKNERGPQGSHILTLDPATMEYRPQQSSRLPGVDAARTIEDPAARLRALFGARDSVGSFMRATLGQTLLYAAEVAPQIAHRPDDVDRAMRWGFGWDQGPFELLDVLGVDTVLAADGREDLTPDARRWASLQPTTDGTARRFRSSPLPPAGPGLQLLDLAKRDGAVVKRTAGASLVDLGDGVLAVEFHSKLNTIGSDTVQMLTGGVVEAAERFAGLVVGNDAPNFCAGANLMLVLLEAQEGNWDEIDLMVRGFQRAILGLRYSPVPVVVAPAGLTLGGGCEMVLHGDRVQAAAESYMGQVEVGVGLIPAGCGTKELTMRAIDATVRGTDPLPRLQHAFELIGFGTVSTSASHAKQLGLMRDVDGITMNRERLMSDAKATVLDRVRDGYQAPPRRTAIEVGGEDQRAALDLGIHLALRGGRITDHDALIARKIAHIMTGGDLPHATSVSEQYLLDLEREAFLSLCGERATLERIGHTLKTGKTLRN